MSSPRVRTNSFPSCTFGLYTAISVWPLGFNLSCSLTRQHMPETVSVRKVNGLPRASFSRNLAVQALPLAMCLAPPPALRDFHPVEFAHAERTRRRRFLPCLKAAVSAPKCDEQTPRRPLCLNLSLISGNGRSGSPSRRKNHHSSASILHPASENIPTYSDEPCDSRLQCSPKRRVYRLEYSGSALYPADHCRAQYDANHG